MWNVPPRRSFPALILTLATLISACGGDSNPATPPPPVSVTVSPNTVTVGAGGSQEFTASVSHATNSGVTWSATGGSVSGAGATVTWTAPIEGGSYAVTATSVEDAAAAASATVTVTGVSVSVSPATQQLFRGQSTPFTATVTGAAPGSNGVTWTATCGATSADGATLTFQAPQSAGDCMVTATSTLDPSQSASGTATVRPEWLVTSTDDTNDGLCSFGHCSLREALLAANTTPGAEIILLGAPPGSSAPGIPATVVPPPLSGTIVLTSALPTITSPLTLVGPGAGELTIDANASLAQQRRALWVSGPIAVTVSGLTLRGARAGEGAGIRVEGGADVTLRELVVTDNEALPGTGGGGIGVVGGGRLELENVVVDGNAARGAQGNGGGIGIAGPVEVVIRGGRIVSNVAEGPFGGGLVATAGATVLLDGVEVTHNTAPNGAGLTLWHGGGSLTVLGGTVSENTTSFAGAASSGGGILAGASGVQPSDRMTVSLSGVVIEGNSAVTQGGGVSVVRNADVTLDQVILRNNSLSGQHPESNLPTIGGGLKVGPAVSIEVSESTIHGNSVSGNTRISSGGGGIGILSLEQVLPPSLFTSVTIRNSTISQNESANNPGGGIRTVGQTDLTVVNSTVSGNTAVSGGGIRADAPATLRNVSVVGNTASVLGAGVLSQAGGPGATQTGGVVTLNNVLLANNLRGATSQGCATSGGGSIVTQGHNLRDDASCGGLNAPSDLMDATPGVDPTLADHGGPTATHTLLDGSPAIDAGDAATCPTTDQRGAERVGTCDIGAFEFGGSPGVTPDGARPPFALQALPRRGAGGSGSSVPSIGSNPEGSLASTGGS